MEEDSSSPADQLGREVQIFLLGGNLRDLALESTQHASAAARRRSHAAHAARTAASALGGLHDIPTWLPHASRMLARTLEPKRRRARPVLNREVTMRVADAGTLHHTCFVVNDVEKTGAELARTLGVGPWGVWTIEPTSATVRGRDVSFSFRVALAPVGGSSYELLAPGEGDSIYVEHLAAHGEGFHHTCIAYESLEAMQRAKAALLRQGRALVLSAQLGQLGELCYFDVPETGALLELLFLTELPPPEKTIG
jgi:catechol 2,3-dioxygenase-like lactoylglutathione lyase family enzyme